MSFIKQLFFLLFLSLTLLSCKSSQVNLEGLTFEEKLETLFPNAEISSIEVKGHFTKSFQLILKEPLDHDDPKAGTFDHYIYLSHVDYNKPTILITEGYDARPRTYELSKIFKGNQVQVEYRFYGKSRSDSIPWDYLKNDQAIEDYHQLLLKLKNLYSGKWISTGISKGGENVLIYKSKYPNDIDVAVAYVAPLINSQEDIRTENHIRTVGSNACRKKIITFQREVLKNRDSILKEIHKYATSKKMSFTELSIEEALEYAVLEFPFSFWQWGADCDEIPIQDTSAKEQFEYINRIVGIGFYNDRSYNELLPSFYQHMIELGYYGFDVAPIKDLLQEVLQPTNLRFAPKNVDLTYEDNYIKKVRDFVEKKGDGILYIYGDYDPWGACAPIPKPNVDAIKMVLKGGSHKTRIRDFSKADQELIYRKLQNWLGQDVKLYPLRVE